MRTYTDEKTGMKLCCADTGPEIEWIVTAVEPKEDYKLLVNFIDGSKKLFDMKPLINKGGIFAKLKDPNYFRKAHTSRNTVVWDEMIDIAPETLYERGTKLA